jgi:hypothetical protein
MLIKQALYGLKHFSKPFDALGNSLVTPTAAGDVRPSSHIFAGQGVASGLSERCC